METAEAVNLQSTEGTLWQPPAIDHFIATSEDADSISDITNDTSTH